MSLTTFHRPPPLRWLLRLLPPPKVMYIGGSDVLPPPLKGQAEQDMLPHLRQALKAGLQAGSPVATDGDESA